MTRRKLPIGIQTFSTLRERDCYYVDKTAHVRALLDEGTHYFLSRPRRFGKSLFLDTLKELFEGNEPLFAGLDIHGRWDWSVRHPVVRLSFGSGDFTTAGPGGGAPDRAARRRRAAGRPRAGIRHRPRTLRRRAGSDCTTRPVSGSRSSWTSTTSRSSTHWRRPKWRGPTETSCAASTPSSRTATPTSGSRSSLGSEHSSPR